MTSKKSDIKVSILCSTYNHKDYICQALDSMLMQKTNFTYEILINDDASNDGTVQIIKNYQKKYPEIIKPVFHKENQYSKGKRNMIIRYLLGKAKGDYIALCEGDDYWTDPNKLQKQVDFLEKNKDYALCFHTVRVVYENKQEKEYLYPDVKDDFQFNLAELLRRNYIQTNSVVYRRQNYKTIVTNIMPGDWYLHVYHARFGKVGFIDEAMSVYRRHEGSMWWNSRKDTYKIWVNHGLEHVALFMEFLKLVGDRKENKEAIEASMGKLINNLIDTDENHKTKLLNNIIEKYPNFVKEFMISQYRDSLSLKSKIDNKETELQNLHSKLSDKQKAISRRDKKILELERKISVRMTNYLKKKHMTFREGKK